MVAPKNLPDAVEYLRLLVVVIKAVDMVVLVVPADARHLTGGDEGVSTSAPGKGPTKGSEGWEVTTGQEGEIVDVETEGGEGTKGKVGGGGGGD